MADRKRVAVIFGGQSSEHEVSRVSAQSVLNNIDREKYDIEMIGITRDGRWLSYDGPVNLLGTGEWQAIAEANLESRATGRLAAGSLDEKTEVSALAESSARGILQAAGAEKGEKRVDVIFPVLHGCNGEDGTIQGMFELAGIPYVGCGVLGSALGMDKAYSKVIFEKEGIPQGKYLVYSRKQTKSETDRIIREVEELLTYPCFVKPSNAGSSVGVSKAHDRTELIEALHYAAKYDRRILIEEFMNGSEAECAVLGNDDPVASTVGEIIPCNEFYDYEAKYQRGDESEAVIPGRFPEPVIQKIRDYAVRAFKALDLSGLARVDFFVHKDTGEIFINEVNTMPGFTQISMYPKLWEASGLPYGKLIEKLIELAYERFEDNKRAID